MRRSQLYRIGRFIPALALAAALGHFAAEARAAAAPQPATHQEILDKLDMIPPAWSQTLPAANRFQLVMGGAGVLDKETGLVWEQAPNGDTRQWHENFFFCYNKNLGGRKGWRVPTIEELASLVDVSNSQPTLPTGHPFTFPDPNAVFWSTTTLVGQTPDDAWVVGFGFGVVVNSGGGGKLASWRTWCVRGGQGYDGRPIF
jgi:Protein of unknown function (DUF1566)